MVDSTSMHYTRLGRTGLRVSVAGLGCGGDAQLGLGRGKTVAEAEALVRSAIDLGVNFFDTSEAYVTESVLGRAIAATPRDRVILCTKSRYRNMASGQLHPVATVIHNFEQSLRKLQVECVDVFMLHGVLPEHYAHVMQQLVPALLRAREQGKFRHLGLSEFPAFDHDHRTMQSAMGDPVWDVIMLACNLLHQGPATTVLPRAASQGLGTAVMYAVRSIFSRAGALQEALHRAANQGQIPAELAADDPLGFLIHADGASSLTDAAYRFARHTPGANVILFGTGDPQHLRSNVASLLKPPLPVADIARLKSQFGHLKDVGLDVPDALRAVMRKK
jgi:aryl-alcohol dehydrogenase-like predicted oxidoreductase